ncbi:MAG: hypothetical protein J6O15_02885, partial [Acinetobacter sp.]|nr:hypothetical protein [Acinetobacter sp.]
YRLSASCQKTKKSTRAGRHDLSYILSCFLKILLIRIYLGFYESMARLTVIDPALFLDKVPVMNIILLNA